LFLRQFLVFKVLGSDKPKQRIAEQMRVVAVVESELELVKVAVKVLRANLTVRADIHQGGRDAPAKKVR
jgi:hypothetical protein